MAVSIQDNVDEAIADYHNRHVVPLMHRMDIVESSIDDHKLALENMTGRIEKQLDLVGVQTGLIGDVIKTSKGITFCLYGIAGIVAALVFSVKPILEELTSVFKNATSVFKNANEL